MDDLIRAGERIGSWFREHRCAGAVSELHPPVSEEVIRSLQDTIPYPLHPHLAQWPGIRGGAPV